MTDRCTPLKVTTLLGGEHRVSEMAREHCAHGTGVVRTSMPPVHRVICCNCGRGGSQRSTRISGHGPHAPVEWFTSGIDWDEP